MKRYSSYTIFRQFWFYTNFNWGFIFNFISIKCYYIWGANIAYSLAKDGELPEIFERKIWFKSTEGLYFTSGLGILAALFLDLTAIATITSTIFTVIYIFVLISHFKISKQYGGKRIIIAFNLIIILIIFTALIRYQWETQKSAFYISIFTFAGALLLEYLYRKIKGRKITHNG